MVELTKHIVQMVSKYIEDGKKIKIIHMNKLHDKFRHFDFIEYAQEDHND